MKILKQNAWIVSIGIVIIGCVGIAVSLKSVGATETNIEAVHSKSVKAIVAKPTNFSASEEYAGFVRGTDQAVITTKITGRIKNIIKREGDIVKKGDPIAVIDANELVAQSYSAQQTIDALQKNLDDTKKYYSQKVDEVKDGGATKEEIQSAKRLRDLQIQAVQTEIVGAQGSLHVAQSLTQETIVRAPFDGIVTRVFQETGQVVSPATPICEVASQSDLSVEIFVSDDIVSYIKKGDVVNAICGNDYEECQGEIIAVSPVSEMNAHKSLVRVQFLKEDPSIYLGQYVKVHFPITDNISNKIIVPEKSIIAKYDEKFVFVVKDGLALERRVVIGHIQSGMVEIVVGITPGDEVIVEGMYDLRNNDVVTLYE